MDELREGLRYDPPKRQPARVFGHMLRERLPLFGTARTSLRTGLAEFQGLYTAFLFAVAVASVLMVVLAILGLFSLGWILATAALALGALYWHPGARTLFIRPVWLAPAILLAGSAILYVASPPFDVRVKGSDASVYLGAAASLARTGSFVSKDPLVAEMSVEQRQAIFASELSRTARERPYYHRLPGGVQLLDPGSDRVSFNFYHLWPAWLAVALQMLGDPGFLAALSFFATLSLISLFLLGATLHDRVLGAAAAILLFLSFPQAYFSRMPLSEVPAQALFLSGLLCFFAALKAGEPARRKNLQLLAGLLWGALCLTRVDSAVYLIPAITLVVLARSEIHSSLGDWVVLPTVLSSVIGLAVLHQVAGNSYELPIGDVGALAGVQREVEAFLEANERAAVSAYLVVATVVCVLVYRAPRHLVSRVIAGTLVLFFLGVTVAWFIRYGFAASAEVFQHIDWLSLYLPGPLFLLIAAGLAFSLASALFERERRTDMIVVAAFLAVPLASILISPMVSATQPWAIRRFVPMVFPLMFLLALMGWDRAFAAASRASGWRLSWGLGAVAVVGAAFFAGQSAFLWREPLHSGLGAETRQLAQKFPHDALVVLPSADAGLHLQIPLQYFEGRSTLVLPTTDLMSPAKGGPGREYIAQQLSKNRRVFAIFLQPPHPAAYHAAKLALHHRFSDSIAFKEVLESAHDRFPSSVGESNHVFHVFEVTIQAADFEIDAKSIQAELAQGIDFSNPVLPKWILEVTGLSNAEPSGRWTDGPTARLKFAQPLRGRYVLSLDVAMGYGRSRYSPLTFRIGGRSWEIPVPDGATTINLVLDLAEPGDTLELRIPEPKSPASFGESSDPRLLGIHLRRLRLSERPEEKAAPATLVNEIDFALDSLPPTVAAAKGLSGPEPGGRWTDAPIAQLRFAAPLPANCTLELTAYGYGPNVGQRARVRIGNASQEFVVPAQPEKVTLRFTGAEGADTLELFVPQPTSPKSRGESIDERLLGIRLSRLKVTSLPAP